jgi:MOSC domain-containing protein YiiM
MHDAAHHLTTLELQHRLPEVMQSPADHGQLKRIFVRPATNERRELKRAQLTPEGGLDGDRWVGDSYYREKNGASDPRCQVSLMNARYLQQLAGGHDAMCLAGDNLIIDFDLSESNLPAGSRLAVGNEVIIEITDLSHTGCSKFERRYGKQARQFTNSKRGKELHLRGRYARIIRGGEINVGNTVRKVDAK